jgi:twitching motility protein PilT
MNNALLDRFLDAVWAAKGTDLLLTTSAPPFMRVDGSLLRLDGEADLDAAAIDDVLEAVLTPAQFFRRHEHDVDFALSWRDRARLRGSAFRQRGCPALALRMIPDDVPSLDRLGVPQPVRDLALAPQGLLLFTGPTGSGKSTSQASLIDWVNETQNKHIITIEEPIEYLHRHKRSAVNQREVGTDTETFAKALRSALREDPDIVLVGEMRDHESIQIALTLAETGHLVISTLHTNDASQALDRIVDVFPTDGQAQIRVQLAGCLAGVVAQRLVPRIGGGQVAAFEVLVGTTSVRNLLREGKSRQIRNVMSTSRADGMQTLEHSLSGLVQSGAVSYEDAVARALVPNEVARTTVTRAQIGIPQRA